MNKLRILNIIVNPNNIRNLNTIIQNYISKDLRNQIIANHNLHSAALYHHDTVLQQFYKQAAVTHIDGMLLLLWAKFLGYPVSRDQRVTYVDWIRPLIAECAEKEWNVFFVGSAPGVGEEARRILKAEFPTLRLAVHHGYFDVGGPESDAVIAAINAYSTNVLLVGMGMPRQERWIFQNREKLRVNVILTAGACMDYVAGAVPTPPRWMGRLGLEWLYRLVSEPKRLAHRYLIEPWQLLPWVIQDLRRKWSGDIRREIVTEHSTPE